MGDVFAAIGLCTVVCVILVAILIAALLISHNIRFNSAAQTVGLSPMRMQAWQKLNREAFNTGIHPGDQEGRNLYAIKMLTDEECQAYLDGHFTHLDVQITAERRYEDKRRHESRGDAKD